MFFGPIEEILKMDRQTQAEICDEATANYILSEEDPLKEYKYQINFNDFKLWNSLSISNMAVIAVHHPKEDVRTLAENVLQSYTEWYRSTH